MKVNGDFDINWWREYSGGSLDKYYFGENNILLLMSDDEFQYKAKIIDMDTGDVSWELIVYQSTSKNPDILQTSAIIDKTDSIWVENANFSNGTSLEMIKYSPNGVQECSTIVKLENIGENPYLRTEIVENKPNILYKVIVDKTNGSEKNILQIHVIDDQCKTISLFNTDGMTIGWVEEQYYSDEEGIVLIFSTKTSIYLGKKASQNVESETIYLTEAINNYDAKYLQETGNFILITDSYGTNTCQITWYNLMGDELWSKEIEDCVDPAIIYSDPDKMEIIFSAESSIDEFHDWLLFRVGFDQDDFLKRNMNKELINYSNASFFITQKGQIKIAGLYNFDYNSQNTIRMKVFPSLEAEGIESMVARGNFLEVSGLEAQGEKTVYLLSDVLHYKPLEEDDEKNDDQGCGC